MAGLIPIERPQIGASNSSQSSFLSFMHLFYVKSLVNGASDSLIIFFKQASVEQSLDTLVLRHWIPQKAVQSFLLCSFSSRLVTMLLCSCCQYLTCIFQLLCDCRIFPGEYSPWPHRSLSQLSVSTAATSPDVTDQEATDPSLCWQDGSFVLF